MYPAASRASSSFVWLTPSDNSASRSVGSASCALVAAAMARRSSSFSACTVLSRRHDSHDAGSRRTAASNASAASDRTPRRNKSRPTAAASARPRYGFGSTNSYLDRPPRRRALWFLADGVPHGIVRPSVHFASEAISWNSPAQSPPAQSANSSAHRCAPPDPDGTAVDARGARNSPAHPLGSAAETAAPPSARAAARLGRPRVADGGRARHGAGGAALRHAVTLGDELAARHARHELQELRVPELPLGVRRQRRRQPRRLRRRLRLCRRERRASLPAAERDSCSCPNSDAHASPAREGASGDARNSAAHAAPADCFTPLNSSAHRSAPGGPASRPPGPGTAAAVAGPAAASAPPRDTRSFAKSSAQPAATEASGARPPPRSRNRRRASAAVSGAAKGGAANGARRRRPAPPPARPGCASGPPSARPRRPRGGSPPRPAGPRVFEPRARATPDSCASACRCRAMMAERARITVFSAGDRFRGRRDAFPFERFPLRRGRRRREGGRGVRAGNSGVERARKQGVLRRAPRERAGRRGAGARVIAMMRVSEAEELRDVRAPGRERARAELRAAGERRERGVVHPEQVPLQALLREELVRERARRPAGRSASPDAYPSGRRARHPRGGRGGWTTPRAHRGRAHAAPAPPPTRSRSADITTTDRTCPPALRARGSTRGERRCRDFPKRAATSAGHSSGDECLL